MPVNTMHYENNKEVTDMITLEIADMHWGKRNPEQYYDEMHNFIITKLKRMDELDIIFIAGDIFDSKQYLYSQTLLWFSKFYGELLMCARMLDSKVVIIEGTKTHDSLQYSIIHNLFNSIYDCLFPYEDQDSEAYMNFEVVYTDKVCEFNYYCQYDDHDYKILLVPEEYIADQESYYKEYFMDKHYDYIIGHGMIDKIWYAKNKKEDKQEGVLSTPVFVVKDFGKLATRTYFGHVHEHKYYGDDTGFTYIGPPSSWEFSAVKDYGMILTTFDKGKFIKDEFLVNIEAPVYDTKILSIRQDYTLEELNVQLDGLLQTAIKNGVYKLRVIVNMQDNLSTFQTMKDFIITKLSNDPMVKLVLRTNLTSDSDAIESDTESNTMSSVEEKSTDIDLSSPIPEQVRTFILKDSGKVIDTEVIKDILDSEE